ncbi:GNAT family N-acetyltransferase [Sphingobacterium faecium]|uniref:GNAT family N-acetyltransferase n=1 Tax=Sphingobacterium faecium TaxID=34087 RepID=UPI002468CD1F|nr:GNAT family N-acetyltransferase [Sphingobacterium faecium]MDH5828677.1 GNAT family N-acetyltransferase [Sphingobacterium faecium]
MQVGFLTEANKRIGMGHLYRCIALAQAFKKQKYPIVFFIDGYEDLIASLLPDAIIRSFDSIKKDEFRGKLFIDVYSEHLIQYNFIETLNLNLKILIIDAIFSDKIADLNYGLIFKIGFQSYSEQMDAVFSDELDTSLIYSGSNFLIFREEFDDFAPFNVHQTARRVLVSMGGTDPSNLTELVIESLNLISDPLAISIVLGKGFDEKIILRLRYMMEFSHHHIDILQNISNMADVMRQHDFGIINGGNTRFELALLGLPFVSISINENQSKLADRLSANGIGFNLGVFTSLNPEFISSKIHKLLKDWTKRKEMSYEMQQLVQNIGKEKIIAIVENFEKPVFRHVSDEELKDAHAIHAKLVESMLKKGIHQWLYPIPYEKLVERQNKKENYGLFIGNRLTVFLSLIVRFDYHEWSHVLIQPGTYWLNTVSVNVENKQKGLGKLAILMAIRFLLKETGVHELYLDCVVNDGFLVNYYQDLGFEIVSETTAEYKSGTFHLALMRLTF